MIRVCFAGATGWTAPPILAAIDAADDLELTSGVSRSAAGCRLSEVTPSRSDGLIFASVDEALDAAEVDVLVDYTSASAVKENVWSAVRAGVHAVVGSSGLTAEDYEELDHLARDHEVGVVAAGNFSVMAAILLTSCRPGCLAAGPVGDPRLRQRCKTRRTQRHLPGTRRSTRPDPYAAIGRAAL